MSLKIYYGSDTGFLADRLFAEASPGMDPFSPVSIVVPNGSVASWLKRRWAQSSGICMGVGFPFFETYLWNALRDLLPEEERPHALLGEADLQRAAAWEIVSGYGDVLDVFRNYCEGGRASVRGEAGKLPDMLSDADVSRRVWQLSGKLANYLREYEFHRRSAVEGWLSGDWRSRESPDEMIRAQAELFRRLFGKDGIFPQDGEVISLRQLLNRVHESGAKRRIAGARHFFFGHSSFSELHAAAIHELSSVSDVYFFCRTVCVEYWGDIETKWEKIRRLRASNSVDESDDYIENELLGALGRAGRETMSLLVDLEEGGASLELCEPDTVRECGTVLDAVRESVRVCTSDLTGLPQDSSLQVAAAPGIVREIETVYNSILESVLEVPQEVGPEGVKELDIKNAEEFNFSDIAVLVSDMSVYGPVIEYVFDSRGEVPYSITGNPGHNAGRFWRALFKLLSLGDGDFGRDEVFSLLREPYVAASFGVTEKDLNDWESAAHRYGICGFFDKADLLRRNVESLGVHTWDYVFRRIRMGTVCRKTPGSPGGSVAPLIYTDVSMDFSLVKLSGIVEELYRFASDACGEERSASEWASVLQNMADEYFRIPADDREGAACYEAFVRLAGEFADSMRSFGGEDRKFPLQFVSQYLEDACGQSLADHGRYLTSGVTIAPFLPMRSVPFKHIYAVGMGEDLFPGRDADSTLEIKELSRRIGEVSKAQINRFLFLEALMSAGERFVMSYVCRDTAKNSVKFPSCAVSVVKNFVSAHILCENGVRGGVFREAGIPLKEDDRLCVDGFRDACFGGLGRTFAPECRIGCALREDAAQAVRMLRSMSGDKHAGRIAQIVLANAGGCARGCVETAAGPGDARQDCAPRTRITAGKMARFLRDPVMSVLSERFGVERHDISDGREPELLPVSLDKNGEKRFFERVYCRVLHSFGLCAGERPDAMASPDPDDIMEKSYRDLILESAAPDTFMSSLDFFSIVEEESRVVTGMTEFLRAEAQAGAECRQLIVGAPFRRSSEGLRPLLFDCALDLGDDAPPAVFNAEIQYAMVSEENGRVSRIRVFYWTWSDGVMRSDDVIMLKLGLLAVRASGCMAEMEICGYDGRKGLLSLYSLSGIGAADARGYLENLAADFFDDGSLYLPLSYEDAEGFFHKNADLSVLTAEDILRCAAKRLAGTSYKRPQKKLCVDASLNRLWQSLSASGDVPEEVKARFNGETLNRRFGILIRGSCEAGRNDSSL